MRKKVFVAIIILVIAGIGFLFVSKKISRKPEKIYTLTNEEISELNKPVASVPEGSRIGYFKVGSAPGIYPKFVSGKLNPLKPKIGEKQEISIKIRDPEGVLKVKGEIQDKDGNFIETLEFKLTEGDEKLGTWTGFWNVHDVKDKFRVKFIAENKKKKKDDLTLFVWLAK